LKNMTVLAVPRQAICNVTFASLANSIQFKPGYPRECRPYPESLTAWAFSGGKAYSKALWRIVFLDLGTTRTTSWTT
jgi:hypothetical protein